MFDITPQSSNPDTHAERHFWLFKAGNERSFNYIYELLSMPVFRFARKKIQDEFEIGTIIQDAFLLVWNRRNEMKNITHIKRYIYNRVGWDCDSYHKKRPRQWTLPLDLYQDNGISLAVYDPQKEIAQREKVLVEQEQISLIEKAIPYLPANKKMLIELRKRGFSYKKIAQQAGQRYQSIVHKEKVIIKDLKSIIIRLEKVHIASKNRPTIPIADYAIYLSPLQRQVLKLQYENQYSINEISNELNLTQFQVLDQHVKAMKKIKRWERARQRRHF